MKTKKRKKPVKKVKPEILSVDQLAKSLADWRLGGMNGYGFAQVVKARARDTARSLGVSYAEVWAEVHRKAYIVIDEAFRSNLLA